MTPNSAENKQIINKERGLFLSSLTVLLLDFHYQHLGIKLIPITQIKAINEISTH
ncbi:MAG: hypothetical protein ACI8RP_001547 [Urechidicola sp.]|jgi:hypothetical protein